MDFNDIDIAIPTNTTKKYYVCTISKQKEKNNFSNR